MIYFVLLQTLPIFLDAIVPPYAAVLISVTLILIFGEVYVDLFDVILGIKFTVIFFLL